MGAEHDVGRSRGASAHARARNVGGAPAACGAAFGSGSSAPRRRARRTARATTFRLRRRSLRRTTTRSKSPRLSRRSSAPSPPTFAYALAPYSHPRGTSPRSRDAAARVRARWSPAAAVAQNAGRDRTEAAGATAGASRLAGRATVWPFTRSRRAHAAAAAAVKCRA